MGLLVSSCPPEIAHPKKFLSLSSALEVITFINHDIHGNTFLVLLRVREVTPHRSLHNSIHQPDSVANRD